jgi:hypothetical protein
MASLNRNGAVNNSVALDLSAAVDHMFSSKRSSFLGADSEEDLIV